MSPPIHVIYARKSTESEDRQVLSIDSQVQELRDLAMRRQVVVSEVLTEAHSAKAPGRPVFGRLMQRVRRREIASIVCWKMDRLSRNHFDTGQILQALADGLLSCVITPERTFTEEGNDRFMGSFELGIATKFIDDLRANVKRGNRARLQRGWTTHIPPPGYINDRATKTIVKDPDRFTLVRRMWDLLLTGSVRPSQILRMANDSWGYRTRTYARRGGIPMSTSVMYELFSNPFYMGVIRLGNGDTYRGAHPLMVNPEEFERAQALLGRPGRPRPLKHEFPFTGLIRCGNCGGMVVAEQHVKPSGRRYVYYRCSHNRTGKFCREPAVTNAQLTEQLQRQLLKIQITPKARAWIESRLTKVLATECGQLRRARTQAENALRDIHGQADTLLSLRLRNQVDDDAYEARRRALQEQRAVLETAMARPQRSVEELLEGVSSALAFSARAHEVFTRGTPVQQRQILETVGLNYTLSAKQAAFQLKNPFRIVAGMGRIPDWYAKAEDLRTWALENGDDFGQLLKRGDWSDETQAPGERIQPGVQEAWRARGSSSG